jgi:hypothetical protein
MQYEVLVSSLRQPKKFASVEGGMMAVLLLAGILQIGAAINVTNGVVRTGTPTAAASSLIESSAWGH